jgi:hypothetical protein
LRIFFYFQLQSLHTKRDAPPPGDAPPRKKTVDGWPPNNYATATAEKAVKISPSIVSHPSRVQPSQQVTSGVPENAVTHGVVDELSKGTAAQSNGPPAAGATNTSTIGNSVTAALSGDPSSVITVTQSGVDRKATSASQNTTNGMAHPTDVLRDPTHPTSATSSSIVTTTQPGFTILSEYTDAAPDLNVRSRTLEVTIDVSGPAQDQNFIQSLEQLIEMLRNDASESDLINLSIENIANPGNAVLMPFGNRGALNADAVLSRIESVAQSNKDFGAGAHLRLTSKTFEPSVGSGPGVAGKANLNFLHKKCVITSKCRNVYHRGSESEPVVMARGYRMTRNTNNFCCAYALVTGLEFLKFSKNKGTRSEKKATAKFNEFTRQLSRDFASRVDSLMERAGVDLRANGASLDDVSKMAGQISPAVVVYDVDKKERQIIFDNRGKKAGAEVVYLIYADKHYDFLKTPQPFFRKRLHCDICGKNVSYGRKHICVNDCIRCHGQCDSRTNHTDKPTKCSNCNLRFKTNICYENHLQPQNNNADSRCVTIRKCPDCCLVYNTATPHICDTINCFACGETVPNDHTCFIKRDLTTSSDDSKKMKNTLITYFDCETEVVSGKHRVCLLTCETLCGSCRNVELEECVVCGERKSMFDNLCDPKVNPVAKFLEYLHTKTRQLKRRSTVRKRHIVLSHNGARFDSHFIMQEIVCNSQWVIEDLINRGRKLLKISIRHKSDNNVLIFLDTYQFISCALSEMPKAFGIPEEKGTFPFGALKRENFGKVFPSLPALENYHPELLNAKKRGALIKWHSEETERMRLASEHYDINDQVRRYCEQDTHILRRCFEIFCMQMHKDGCEPLLSGCVTIAMAVLKIYMRRYMPNDSIGE